MVGVGGGGRSHGRTNPTGRGPRAGTVASVADEFDNVREIALSLPETNERLSHGMPTFFIRDKKVFVSCVDELREIITESYRLVAPKTLVKLLDTD